MNSAEFKTLREAVGLSVSHVAKLAGVSERSVRYWESGRTSPPDDVSEQLTDIDAMLNDGVNNTLFFVNEMINKHDTIGEFNLVRYRDDKKLWKKHPEFKKLPVAVHAAYLARVKRALEANGDTVNIIYSH